MNISLMLSNQHTFFGHGSLKELVPLLSATPLPTLLFCGRSFLQGAAYAALKPQLDPLLTGHEIVSHEASPAELDA